MEIESGLRSPTYIHSAGDVCVCPAEDFGYFLPVAYVLKLEVLYRRSCYYHSVELLLCQHLKVLIEHHHVLYRRVLRRVALYLHKVNLKLKRSIGEQAYKVGFCGYLQRHEIENHNSQRAYILCRGARVVHNEDVLALKQLYRGEFIR